MTGLPKALDSRKWIMFFVDHPFLVFALLAAVTGWFAFHLPGLKIKSSVSDLAIENLPETKSYDAFKKEFGTEEIILVKLKASNVFEPSVFQSIETLSRKLAQIPGIERVISLPFIKRDVDLSGKMSLPAFERILDPVDLFRKNLLSEDKKTTIITLVLSDREGRSELIRAVDRVLKSEKQRLAPYQIGLPNVSEALGAYTERDFFRLPPTTFIVIGIVLILTFRSLYGVLLPLGCLLIALTWTFGLIAWTRTPLSMVTMIVPVFLMAVGTAYCIHILSEYRHAAARHQSPAEAVFQTYVSMAFPTFLTVLTTLIGLGSLLVNNMVAIREFALFSCFGMGSMLILLLSFMPAVLGLLPLTHLRKERYTKDYVGRVLETLIDLHLRHPRLTLLLMALLASAAALGIIRLKVETNPVEYFKVHTSIYQHFHDIYQDGAGSFPMNVVLDGRLPDYFEDPSRLQRISELQEFLNTLEGVDKSISFVDYLKLVNYATNRFQPEFYVLPKEPYQLRMLMNSYKSILGQDLFERFMNQDLSRTNILLRTHLSSSRAFLNARDLIRTHAREPSFKDMEVQVTGFGLVLAQSSHLLTMGQIKSLSLTLILIFGVMLFLFMSTKVGFIALLPNVFPILLLFGIMGWAGFRLSVTTSLIASIALGLSVDDTIHYLFRYNREFKRDPDRNSALRHTLRGVGRPIILTTLTLCAGFSVLIFSSFKPTSEFGVLMIITLTTALLGDIIILPSLMLNVNLVTVWDLLKSFTTFDRLSDAVAHQLNQPLNAIKMGSDFIRVMIEKGERIPDHSLSEVAAEISEQVDRASLIISRLREFGQRVDVNPEKVDVNPVIRDVLALMEHQFALQKTELKIDLSEPCPPIMAHTNRLKQIFFNLLTNAWEAMNEKKGTPAEAHPNTLHIRTFSEGDRVWITISDTGIGLSEHERERAFEPFFTTKETGKGRGLGLAITIGIMRDYGGKIHLESEKWRGTTLTLIFPTVPLSYGQTPQGG